MGTVPDFRRPCENSGTVLFLPDANIVDKRPMAGLGLSFNRVRMHAQPLYQRIDFRQIGQPTAGDPLNR